MAWWAAPERRSWVCRLAAGPLAAARLLRFGRHHQMKVIHTSAMIVNETLHSTSMALGAPTPV